MNGKSGDKKLGRNPFDHRRPSRAKRGEEGEVPEFKEIPAESAKHLSEAPDASYQESPGGSPFQSNPAWFFVDLWTGALMEPYFFWAKSVDLIKKSLH